MTTLSPSQATVGVLCGVFLFIAKPLPYLLGLSLSREESTPAPGTFAAQSVSEHIATIGYWTDPGFLVGSILFIVVLLGYPFTVRRRRWLDVFLVTVIAPLAYTVGPVLTHILAPQPNAEASLVQDIEWIVLSAVVLGHGAVALLLAFLFALWAVRPRTAPQAGAPAHLRARYHQRRR